MPSAKGGASAADDPNRLIITKKEIEAQKKKQQQLAKKREQEARAPPPQSKAQLRKLAQIAARKEKEAARQSVIASLKANALKNEHLKFLGSSATLNHKASKRQRLQRAVMARREGAALLCPPIAVRRIARQPALERLEIVQPVDLA